MHTHSNVNSADVPVAFVPVQSTESKMSELSHKSKFNRKEADLALGVVEMLQTKGGLSPKQIAIVTPYNGQVRGYLPLPLSAYLPSDRCLTFASFGCVPKFDKCHFWELLLHSSSTFYPR